MPGPETLIALVLLAVVGSVTLTAVLPATIVGSMFKAMGSGLGLSLVSSSSGTEVVLNDIATNNAYYWSSPSDGLVAALPAGITFFTPSVLSASGTFTVFTPSTAWYRITEGASVYEGTIMRRFEMGMTFSFNMTSTSTFANIAIPDVFPVKNMMINAPRAAITCTRGVQGAKEYSAQLRVGTGAGGPPFVSLLFWMDATSPFTGTCAIEFRTFLPFAV